MKLKTIIIALIFLPEPAIAQDTVLQEMIPVNISEQVFVIDSQLGHSIHTENANPSKEHVIEVNTIASWKNPAARQDLFSEITHSDAKIINDWYKRIYESLRTQSIPRKDELTSDMRLRSNNELIERVNESHTVLKIVLKETLQFTKERLPEIDMLIRALKFEVSSDMASKKFDMTEVHAIKNNESSVSRHSEVNDRLFLKTGLRLPIDSGRLSLVSESVARYGNVSSFFSLYLGGHFNNTVGLAYDVNNDIHLRVERQTNQAMNSMTSNRSNERFSVNLIHLVCNF